jgi:hypothetical protein
MVTKKTDKTPANDAGSDVAAGGEALPAIPSGREYNITDLAEVFRRSGYFGELTTAQLAVHIIAGRSLGLDPARSVFDLVIGPGPTIDYRIGQPFEQTSDKVEAEKAANRLAANRTEPNPPPPGETTADKIEAAKAAGSMVVCRTGGDNVVDIRKTQNSDTKANAGPPVDPPPAAGEPGVEVFVNAADVTGVEAPGQSRADSEGGRQALSNMLTELGHNRGAIEKRIVEFDKADAAGKAKILDDCQKYYLGKLDAARADVLAKLAADGKTKLEQQKGFYLFADVPPDPHDWTFTDATKAVAAIERFFSRK